MHLKVLNIFKKKYFPYFFWCLTFSFSEMSYALFTGQDDSKLKHHPEMEVLYVNGTTKICHSKSNYPITLCSKLSGGSFLKNDLIVACGGGNPLTSACYSMSNDDLKWTHFANLTRPNWGFASVIVNSGLWVTGNDDIFSLRVVHKLCLQEKGSHYLLLKY